MGRNTDVPNKAQPLVIAADKTFVIGKRSIEGAKDSDYQKQSKNYTEPKHQTEMFN